MEGCCSHCHQLQDKAARRYFAAEFFHHKYPSGISDTITGPSRRLLPFAHALLRRAVNGDHAETAIFPRWCVNRPLVAPSHSRLAYQRIRAETGMPSPVIRLSTLHPIFASVR